MMRNDDLISRAAAIEQLERRERFLVGDKRVSVESFKNFLRNRPAIDAEPVRQDNCRLCRIKETQHGVIEFYGVGWQGCITKRDKGYFMVVDHEGEQVAIPIDYCPNCGAKMDAES